MSAGDHVIEVTGLCKRLDDVEAVNDLTFAIEPGSVFGLIGQNGAGKTTTIRLLLGLLHADSGAARVFGEDSRSLSRACRQRIGYLSEEPFPFDALDLVAKLEFLGGFFDNWDQAHALSLLDRFELPCDRRLGSMSAGERRRAELALTLAPRPDLLILDDPAAGLDAAVRRDFLGVALAAARDEGKTVLFTSHALHDVEKIVDTVGIMRGGRLRALATLDELKLRTRRLVLELPVGCDAASLEIPGKLTESLREREFIVVTEAYDPALEARLCAQGAQVTALHMSLEEIFLVLADEKTTESKTPEESR